MIRRPPRSTRTDTLLPYTTLLRSLSEQASTVRFTMTTEGGEWRIGDLPDATIVSDEFVASRYQQVSLYFFDPTGEILVPEPAFVPRGGQLASALVRGLQIGRAHV